jgi:hypothetical protein
MTGWDRIQRMDLELRQQRQNVDQLSEQVEYLRAQLHEAIGQRDLARRVAVRLEQENHELAGGICALCSGEIVAVAVVGEAR